MPLVNHHGSVSQDDDPPLAATVVLGPQEHLEADDDFTRRHSGQIEADDAGRLAYRKVPADEEVLIAGEDDGLHLDRPFPEIAGIGRGAELEPGRRMRDVALYFGDRTSDR